MSKSGFHVMVRSSKDDEKTEMIGNSVNLVYRSRLPERQNAIFYKTKYISISV